MLACLASAWLWVASPYRIGSAFAADVNYQRLWWRAPAGSESGWGINFAHQGEILFAPWFTYDAAGKPRWPIARLQKAPGGAYTVDGVAQSKPIVKQVFGTDPVCVWDAAIDASLATNYTHWRCSCARWR